MFLYSLLFFLALAVATVSANVSMAEPFSDHMVLQRGAPTPIFGKASPGENVSVSFRGVTANAVAGADGNWKVLLDVGAAGGPFSLKVTGNNTLTLNDVLVGEVWLAGGQSNMQFNMQTIGGPNLDSAKAANFPDLRLMDFMGDKRWKACTPLTALAFSATAYYYGRDLHKALKVPVGILLSALHGTEIERWMDPASIVADPVIAGDPEAGNLYRQWITPLLGFGVKGFIWYQGEYNATTDFPQHPNWVVSHYRGRFQALIGGWRKAWGMGNLPFYFVQLPNMNGRQTNPGDASPWAELREAQRLALAVDNTAMAVTIDIGQADNLHPHNKWDVGKRLSLAARAREYGEKDLAYAAPLYQDMQVQGNVVRLRFLNAEGLMVQGGGETAGMAIAGADNRWSWADVVIRKDTVIVSSAAVAAPVKVRYGWGQNPPCNLYNGAGLPMSPFKTDGPQLPVALLRPISGLTGPGATRMPGLLGRGVTGLGLLAIEDEGIWRDARGRRLNALAGKPVAGAR